MFCYLFATVTVEHSEEPTRWITGDLVKVAVSVLHIWTVGTIFIFGVCVLFNTSGTAHMPSYVLGASIHFHAK